jgi:hypothetical protein
MLGRSDFPAMDDVVSITFNLTMNAAAIGSKWQGIISLAPPIELDNRPGSFALLSFLYSARFYGPHNVRITLLSNDLVPDTGVNILNPRKDVLQSIQLMIEVPAGVSTFTTEKLVVWAIQAAPESPITVPVWGDVDPAITEAVVAPFEVRNKDAATILTSKWYEIT